MAGKIRRRDCERLGRELVSKPDPSGYYIVIIRSRGLEELSKTTPLDDAEIEQMGGDIIAIKTKSRRHALQLAVAACKLGIVVA